MQTAAVVTILCLPLLIVSTAQSRAVEYKAGQVWTTQYGPTVVTILKVENLPKVGKVVHVRIDKVLMFRCEGLEPSSVIQHLAFQEKMLRGGLVSLVKKNSDLPDSYFTEYQKWEQQQDHVPLNVPIQQIIRDAALPGPIICN
jgi:hypothetical protein